MDRTVVGVGNDYPPAYELAFHTHKRGQLLHAMTGVMAVSTPEGAWVTPPEQAVWIPAGMPHAVRMIGPVSTRCVMIAGEIAHGMGPRCCVVGVSRLLDALLEEAVVLPVEYDEAGRDGLVMRLVVEEVRRAPVIPLAVPFPRSEALARRCHAFIAAPDVKSGIDEWADALGLNRRSFTRHFRRETGMSFAEWRQQACLAAALPRIAAGEAITSVALDLGYDSPASFSTMFRRVLGSAPSRYR
ncbi:MAG: helix-turn-helix transcriptional regulator [Sphingobium sp.]